MPRAVRPAKPGSRRSPLNLQYLVTAYGREDSDKTP